LSIGRGTMTLEDSRPTVSISFDSAQGISGQQERPFSCVDDKTSWFQSKTNVAQETRRRQPRAEIADFPRRARYLTILTQTHPGFHRFPGSVIGVDSVSRPSYHHT